MALGAAELIEEVSEGKITGEEDRYSHTDLWDFAANVEGAEASSSSRPPPSRKPTRNCSPTSRPASRRSTRSSRRTRTGDGSQAVRRTDRSGQDRDAGDPGRPLREPRRSWQAHSAWSDRSMTGRPTRAAGVRPAAPTVLRDRGAPAAAVAAITPAVLARLRDVTTAATSRSPRAGAGAHPVPRRAPAGILSLAPAAGIAAALRQSRRRIATSCATRSGSCRRKHNGSWTASPPEPRDRAYPPTDSGLFGDEPPPADLIVVVGLGASLFDERFGPGRPQAPRARSRCRSSPTTGSTPPAATATCAHGLGATHPDAAMFALRQLMRRTRGALTLRWMQEGFNATGRRPEPGEAPAAQPARVQGRHRQPRPDRRRGHGRHRLGGGRRRRAGVGRRRHATRRSASSGCSSSSGTARRSSEQETIIGRHKVDRRAARRRRETDDPSTTSDDPEGEHIPLDAHIRLANPRTPATETNRILRRGFNYSRGFDAAGQLDQGLAFV